MKIKRLIAGGLSAAAGITMLLGSVIGAVTFSDGMGTAFFEKTDSTYKSPLIVVGDTAGIVDVIGATDIAASFVSNYAVVATDIPAVGATLTVSSGGADLATTATKLYVNDSISAAKTVLTAEDIPTVLASGSFEDDENDEYNFEQYIYLGTASARRVTFGDNDEDQDPELFVDTGVDPTTNYFYSTKIVFDTAVNFSNTDVHGNDLTLFGSKYTIAATSTNAQIVLFGSAAKETINAGETKTVTFGGTDYTIQVLGIQDQSTAIVKVNDESEEISEGAEETVSGLTFYVDTIIKWDAQTGDGYAGYVQLSLGSQKMIFEDGEPIAIGEDEDDVDGTEVALTGTDEISVMEVKVAAEDTEFNDIRAGDDNAFEDPVWGTFKTEFHGMEPAEGSGNREAIELSSSGDYAKVELTTSKGDTKQVDFAYYDDTSLDLKLSKKKIHVVEGAAAAENDYIIVNAGDFSHLFEVDEIDPAGASAGEVKFKDAFSSKVYEVTLPAGNNQVQKVIDGQTYYINVSDGTPDTVIVTWKSHDSDSGMTYEDPGSHQTIFPTIETKYGALVALAENVDKTNDDVNFTGAVTNFVLPGGNACATSCTEAGVSYTITTGASTAVAFTDGNASVIVVEEDDVKDNQNSVRISTRWDASDSEVELKEAAMSAGLGFVELDSNDDVEKSVDIYGTVVEWDKTDKNSADISYPNDQAIVGIGVGSDPAFSVGGGTGGTYNAAIPITNPVTKFASEITATSSLDKNIILVGGPCANTLVKTLLDEAWETTDSCNYWLNTHETLQNNGNGLIKIVEDVFGSGKKALIVAGTQGADTRNLIANKVIKPTVYSGLSGSEYVGSV